ncbi:CAP domain-containing protein [Aquihabitans daechungensis]|uniref:CAP domain-containing protein n=1 Tax=Aquihabitans daechungensis TaxID=1052257 RepID=UPI003B9DCB60
MTTAAAPTVPAARRRPRRALTVTLVLAVVVLLAGCLSANQTKMVDLVNASRRNAGRPAVSANQAASDKAQAWAARMARTGVVEHTGGGSRVNTSGLPKWCSVGENVGKAPTIDALHAAWMRSSTHRGNILGNFNRIGTGVVRKGDVVYGIQIFYRAC